MYCSCIRDNYNLRIEHVDCSSFLYQDLSDWMDEYDFPDTYNVRITPPVGEQVVLAMNTVGVSKVTPNELGSPVVDGIYCFQTQSCGILYTRYKAITCLLDCKLDFMISQISKTGKENDLLHAHRIESYINAIHYNAERDFKDEAEFYYKLAKKELDCYNCKC